VHAFCNSGLDRNNHRILVLDTQIHQLEIDVVKANNNLVLSTEAAIQVHWMEQAKTMQVKAQQLGVERQNLIDDSTRIIECLKGQGLIGTPDRRETEKENISLEHDKLFFVNRENAVDQLQAIHESNYYRAATHDGAKWVIPVCDNFFGMGKSRLARMYIELCQARTVSSPEAPSKFRAALNQALTVHIAFSTAELQNEIMFEQILMQKLRNNLIPLFKVAPVCLYESYVSSHLLLTATIAEAGPLFVALDEIGLAFTIMGKNDIERRDLFLIFCDRVLRLWLLVPGLFFLVLGRGSFLHYVGYRPGEAIMSTVSSITFKRLSLQLLRSKSIIEIMKKTSVSEKCKTTLFDQYQLTSESAEVVANHLFAQTTGNPRHLLEAFQRCKTYEVLMEYDGAFIIDDVNEFRKYVSDCKGVVDYLLLAAEDESVVNLTQLSTFQGRSTPYEIIANNVLIAWEGELEAAQLLASLTIIKFMATNFLSFRES
jgi:hypothetical protein